MHSFPQVHALSIDLCKNHHRKRPVTCACRFGQALVRSRMRARGRVGLPPGGSREPQDGPGIRGACLWKGQRFGAGFFWKQWQFALLSAENYNRTTTDHTTESQSAQSLHD